MSNNALTMSNTGVDHRVADHRNTQAMTEYPVSRWLAGQVEDIEDWVAEEVPVALEYNGLSYAVMMCSPQDLEDFARGFSLSECIVEDADEIYDIQISSQEDGIQLAITIPQSRFWALKSHRRSLAGRTGCGLCGKESLAQLAHSLDPFPTGGQPIAASAIENACNQLKSQQHLFSHTGSVHAAAWSDTDGNIVAIREDVGRHNALDKLIGNNLNSGLNLNQGMLIMTSRASYEIVQKAAACSISVIAAVSGPTGLAVRLAQDLGVTLVGFARDSRLSVYAHPERIV
ncbi:formate dehydrogenase accessory sulfurtransferase FdhD [Amphritea balenae]|nr:formate dehydrogenase accessory sulfurtransferase FdhD [Amphritea balenae]GGK66917.1 sulfurtransferase FdhD [Amphritea balenae]